MPRDLQHVDPRVTFPTSRSTFEPGLEADLFANHVETITDKEELIKIS